MAIGATEVTKRCERCDASKPSEAAGTFALFDYTLAITPTDEWQSKFVLAAEFLSLSTTGEPKS